MAPGNRTALRCSKNKVTEALHLNSVLFEFLILELLNLLNFPASVSSTRIIERFCGTVHDKAHGSVPDPSAADRAVMILLFFLLCISLLGKTKQKNEEETTEKQG